jgi:hypothetical protein
MRNNPQEENLLQYLGGNEGGNSAEPKERAEEDLLQFLPNSPENQKSQLRANVYASTPIPPDQASQQWSISQQTKIPVSVVRTQENQIKQMTELNSINYDDLVNNFPKVAAQLADSSKAAAIRDDVDSLSYFEKVVGSVKQEYRSSQENVEQADILFKQMLSDVTGNEKYKLTPLEENNLALINQSQSQKKNYGLGFVSSIPAYTANAIPTILDTLPATLGGAVVGGGAGLAVGGPVGLAVGAKIGSNAGTALSVGKLETGLAYQELRNLVDEKGKPIEKEVAAGGAITTGVVNGLIELIPFGEAADQVKKAFSREGVKQLTKTEIGREYLKNVGKLAVKEGVAEGLQELTSVVFAEGTKAISSGDYKLIGMKDTNDSEGFLKFLSDSAGRIAESAKAGLGGGLGLGLATGGISAAQQARGQKQQETGDKSIIADIVNRTKESKIFKRNPELFKAATDNTLGEQEVYLPAEEVQTFFQTKTPEEVEAFYQIAPEARGQIEEALQTGGNVVLKGNSAAAAFANEAFSELQNFAKLSPETLSEKEAQDEFLTNVSDNVALDERANQQNISQSTVKNNIKKQILGLNLPSDEANNLITTLNSYYDTKSSRYGSEEAKKVLDTYLGNLEVKNAVFNRLQPMVRNTKVDELDKFINQARKFTPKKATKPILKFLKEKGGVKVGSNLAGEMNALGINNKTAPGLFRKEGGIGDVDNFPAEEFLQKFPNSGAEIEGDYISRQAVLDLIGREVQGFDISKEISLEEEKMYQFLEDLDRIGVEIKNADNEAVKKAIEGYRQEQEGYFQTPQTPEFYSALEKQITDLPQGKGSPEQWAGIIKNLTQKGVKQEEIEWSGVQDWLKEQKGSVTKEQIVDYLKANQIQVREVVKGKPIELDIKPIDTSGWTVKTLFNKSDGSRDLRIFDEKGDVVGGDSYRHKGTDQEIIKEVAEKIAKDLAEKQRSKVLSNSQTKFKKYTLPGGENYRELLLTLPEKKKSFEQISQEKFGKPYESTNRQEQMEVINSKNTTNYKSSHYEEPDILAHIRFNERTDKDGNRVMFIEELQSDWHQEGRKKGYAGGEKEKEMRQLRAEYDRLGDLLEKKTEALRTKLKSVDNLGFSSTSQAIVAIKDHYDYAKRWDITEEDVLKAAQEYKDTYEAKIDAGYKVDNNMLSGVPDAPFKTTWPELAFKRALLYATENGFDKIAWTTGEQQAERYDLSKQIKEINYQRSGEGLYDIEIKGLNNERVFEESGITLSRIDNVVGKEIAKKIEENAKDFRVWGQLSDLDLKIGGEGMKAFYDKIVPTMANKLVKKFGGKVEDTKVSTATITDEDRKLLSDLNDEGAPESKGDTKVYQKVHSLEITPSMRESIQSAGLPLFQNEKNPQGQTQFFGQKPVISLFKSKNRSTVLHELGHVFLQIESEVAKLPDVSDQIKNDWKTVEDWLGIKDGKITVEAHEKFARGFEAYLREGKAPSIGLRNAFRKFKSWLTKIYKNVKSLNVEISDPVRRVFDRMLATDEAIDQLKNNPIFRADEKVLAMLDEEEKANYLAITENADERAKEKLLAKALKEANREKTKSYKEQKQRVRAAISEELAKTHVYRTLNALKSEDGFKLNRSDVENYEGDFIKKLPKDIISEDGVSVDEVADFMGFKDGGAMLNELANAPNFKSEVTRLTNDALAQQFSDMVNDGSLNEEALNISQNDLQAKKILYELNAANKKIRTFVDSKEAYQQKAKDIIAKKQIKDATNSNTFYLAEIKAAREAGIALGQKDYAKAVEAKKKQLLNHYLFKESLAVKEEVESLQRRATRYNKKPSVGKVWIEEDYRERIVNLLQDFGLVEKQFDHEKTNIADLEQWKREQTEEGVLGLVDFSEIAAFQDKDNFRNLTTEEFHALDNSISNLAHVGEGLRSLVIEGKRVELAEISKEIKDTIESNLKKREEIRGNLTPKQKLNAAFESFMMPLIKVKNIALKLDGEKPLGTFYNYFVKPVGSGEVARNKMTEDTYEKLDAIYEKHFGTKAGEISGKKVFIPEVNFSYSKQDMISFALNWGNSTNRKRIKDGFKYSDAQVNAILSHLTKNEWEFVQDMWDLIGSHFDDVAKLQKKLVGFKPGKVRPVSFSTKTADGKSIKLKGGYYPIAYSDALTTTTNDQDLNAIFGSVNSSINFEKSYTKGRSDQKITKKIDLTLKPAFRHLSNVLSDLALKEQVWNSYKILNNGAVKEAISDHAGKETLKQLDVWLKDIFGSGLMGQDAYSGLVNNLRAGATISTMGLKLSTALMQPSGFTQSIVKIGAKNMLAGLFKVIGNGNPFQINKAVDMAMEKSKILKDRSKTYHRDIYDTLRKMERKGIIAEKATAIYFWPMAKMQMLVDIPTWLGAYNKGLKDFNGNDDKAVDYADLVIAQAQGSGLEQDLSAFERGSAFGSRKSNLVKIFTAFYTYFNAKLNLAAESYRKTNFSKPRDVARFASDFLLLFWLETLIGNLLTGKLPDFEDDDEDKVLAYNLKLLTQTFLSQFPISREAVSVAQGFNGTPSGLSGIEKIVKGSLAVGKELSSDEEIDISKVIEGLNDAAGIVFKYPSSQIDTFIDASQKAAEGEEVAPIDYLLRPKK